jgi:Asp-tRNA(Asn)/Glu-tRNA(Gln) amidotransferase C subunit
MSHSTIYNDDQILDMLQYIKFWDMIKRYDVDHVLKNYIPHFSDEMISLLTQARDIRKYFEKHSHVNQDRAQHLVKKYKESLKRLLKYYAREQGYILKKIDNQEYKFVKLKSLLFRNDHYRNRTPSPLKLFSNKKMKKRRDRDSDSSEPESNSDSDKSEPRRESKSNSDSDSDRSDKNSESKSDSDRSDKNSDSDRDTTNRCKRESKRNRSPSHSESYSSTSDSPSSPSSSSSSSSSPSPSSPLPPPPPSSPPVLNADDSNLNLEFNVSASSSSAGQPDLAEDLDVKNLVTHKKSAFSGPSFF